MNNHKTIEVYCESLISEVQRIESNSYYLKHKYEEYVDMYVTIDVRY